MQLGLAALFVKPSQKKGNGNGKQFVDDKPFINKREPSSATVAKSNFNNGEHTFIPVLAKMIHFVVSKWKRLILTANGPLDMVKFIGAVRSFSVNIKNVKID